MEAPRSTLHRQKRRSKCLWIIVAIAILVVLIVAIVPTAVILSGKHQSKGLSSTVILPLYIYPLEDAWNPLFNAINSTMDVPCIVIVNPDSGPGSSPLPNDDFLPVLRQLNAFPQVQTVGYIPTDYGNRNISDVIQDVETYAGWASNASGIAMHGIFFDEAPHEYSEEDAEFMRSANNAVLGAAGIEGNKTIIHNPGTIPDEGLRLDTTDITVVFEQSFDEYKSQESRLTALSGDRSSYSYMVHSVPSSVNLGKLLDQMSRHAEYLFVTSRDSGYYESFGQNWRRFVDMIPT